MIERENNGRFKKPQTKDYSEIEEDVIKIPYPKISSLLIMILALLVLFPWFVVIVKGGVVPKAMDWMLRLINGDFMQVVNCSDFTQQFPSVCDTELKSSHQYCYGGGGGGGNSNGMPDKSTTDLCHKSVKKYCEASVGTEEIKKVNKFNNIADSVDSSGKKDRGFS